VARDGGLNGTAVHRAQAWASAVQTYRQAVDVYRTVLELRAQRATRISGGALPRLPSSEAEKADELCLEGLTVREREVAHLIARGYTNQQIAEKLVVTRGTAANHVAHILFKLGVTNRTQVAAMVFNGTIPEPISDAAASD
jgi:DNA-binding NarL/FixJ family response regulator